MRNKHYLLIVLAVVSVLAGCAGSSGGYAARVLYTDPTFDPAALGGKPIAMLPLITATGVDTAGALQPRKLRWYIREYRRDLRLVPVEETYDDPRPAERRYFDSLRVQLCRALYNGDVVLVQQSDTIRSAIPSAYFISFIFRGGAKITSLDHVSKRRVILEVELWDARKGIVLVRVRGRGVSVDSMPPDDEFVREAILVLVQKIPQLPMLGDHDASW